jgi:hypothetical protein
VRLGREGRRRTLAAAALLELPEGVLRLSMTEPNVIDLPAFRQALSSVLERAGALGASRVGLVLPDPVARVALISTAELTGKGRTPLDELLRFRLRKSLPFDVKDARLAWLLPASRTAENAVVVAIFKPVLESYEAVCRSLGLFPGLVELSGLALLGAELGAHAAGDRLLVNWDDAYVTLALTRDGWPLLIRTLSGPQAGDPSEVAREAANTLLYHRERLGGVELAQVALRSAGLPPEAAASLLGGTLDKAPELIQPLAGLEASGLGPSQALAGAAACLRGRRA